MAGYSVSFTCTLTVASPTVHEATHKHKQRPQHYAARLHSYVGVLTEKQNLQAFNSVPFRIIGGLFNYTKQLHNIQCVRKVAVHLRYGPYIWLSVPKLPLQCAVVSLYSVVKQRLKCNTGKVCDCLIQFLLCVRSWTSLSTVAYRGGGGWGFKTHPEIPKFCQS
jgi:hypothetical protein